MVSKQDRKKTRKAIIKIFIIKVVSHYFDVLRKNFTKKCHFQIYYCWFSHSTSWLKTNSFSQVNRYIKKIKWGIVTWISTKSDLNLECIFLRGFIMKCFFEWHEVGDLDLFGCFLVFLEFSIVWNEVSAMDVIETFKLLMCPVQKELRMCQKKR